MTLGIVIALLAGLPLASVHATTPTPAPTSACTGRCIDVRVPLPKGVHVTSNRVRLLVPTGYALSKARYPVIYALCGALGDETEWTKGSDLASFSAKFKVVIVMPDCGGRVGQPGWDSDWANGRYQWETYYIKVLIPWINQHVRTLPHDNGIMGLSMGGYGAVILAERHPALFKAVATYSGLLDTQYGAAAVDSGSYAPIWGPSSSSPNWTAHNPTAQAAKLKGKAIFLSCGTGGPVSTARPTARPSDNAGAQVEEQFIFQTNLPFIAALKEDHIPFTSNIYAGGEHSWTYFQYAVHWGLPRLVQALSPSR